MWSMKEWIDSKDQSDVLCYSRRVRDGMRWLSLTRPSGLSSTDLSSASKWTSAGETFHLASTHSARLIPLLPLNESTSPSTQPKGSKGFSQYAQGTVEDYVAGSGCVLLLSGIIELAK